MAQEPLFYETPELVEAKRKQEIAAMLLKQLSGGAPQVQNTRILARQPLLGTLFNAGSQLIAKNDLQAADRRATEITQGEREKVMGEYSAASDELMKSPDKQSAIAKFMASRNPMVRALAAAELKAMREQQEKEAGRKAEAAKAAAGLLGDKGATSQGLSVLQSGNIDPNVAIPPAPAPQLTFPKTPDGKTIPFTVNTDPKTGKQTGTAGSLGSNISVENRMAGKEGELALTREQEDLAARQTAAKTGMQNLQLAQRVKNLIRDGAQAGGFQNVMQTARKLAATFGVTVPETGFTDELRSALGERILRDAKALGPNPSNRDAEIIAQIVGSIDTDPNALMSLTAVMEGRALKDLADFQQFVGIKRQGGRPELYDTADVGIQAPQQIAGTLPYRLKAAQMMLQQGMSPKQVAQYTGLKEEDIPPVDADMAFGLSSYVGQGRGPLAAKPAQQKPASQWKVIR